MSNCFVHLSLVVLIAAAASGQETGSAVTITATQGEPGPLSRSLAIEARAAIDRGVKWLLAQQNPEGHWSNEGFPALTALPLWALVRSGGNTDTQAVDRAVRFILSCVHDDGSIWREPAEKQKGGGLSTYNTSLCMVALHAVGDPNLVPIVQKARRYLAGTQHFGADDYRGGMGYDAETGKPYADLSNSYMAYEAMRLTQNVEDLRKDGDKPADLDWKAVEEFLAKIQNKPAGTNDDNAGGFAYHPSESKAGTVTNEAGEIRFRSYGSMTYAGLLSLIYAEVDKGDPRVQSAFDWSVKHWTLEENPGMGPEGLYYFYNVLPKALAAYGRDQLTLADGRRINWRAELIRKLLNLQKIDPKNGQGYWVNEAGRWWEADPVLVTSYSLLALEIALK
ncbi:MAG: prenyltransferase/squalene oxidase repeat-containing protein [Verrucomicrobiota bacterium]